MEKNVAAQLTAMFASSNGGRRLSAAEGDVVEHATGFLSSAISALADHATSAIEKIENLSGSALEDALAKLTAELNIESPWGPESNMGGGQFFTAIKDATTLAEAEAVYREYEAEICTPWQMNIAGEHQGEFTDEELFGEKVATECYGPQIKLEYVPKECIVSDDDHSIECKPGKIVMKKKPGECIMKHWNPFVWISKECKAETDFWKKEGGATEGGETYTLWFDQLEKPLMSGFGHGISKVEEEAAAPPTLT
jgi:hypothetical protein